jgi:hypothetical protein
MKVISIDVEVVIPTHVDLLVKLDSGNFAVAYLSPLGHWLTSDGVHADDYGDTYLDGEVVAWCRLPE